MSERLHRRQWRRIRRSPGVHSADDANKKKEDDRCADAHANGDDDGCLLAVVGRSALEAAGVRRITGMWIVGHCAASW